MKRILVIGKRIHRYVPLLEEHGENAVSKVGNFSFSFDEEKKRARILFTFNDWYITKEKLDLEYGYNFNYHDIGELKNIKYTVKKLMKRLKKITRLKIDKEGEKRLTEYVKDLYYPDNPPTEENFWEDMFTEDDLIWKSDPEWIKKHRYYELKRKIRGI